MLDLARDPPRRILVIRLSSLGDVVDVLWSVAALRAAFPDAAIDWLVEDRFAAVLEGHPHLNRVLVFPRRAFRRRAVAHGTGRGVRAPTQSPAPTESVRPDAAPPSDGLRRWVRAAGAAADFLRRLRAARYDVAFDFHHNLKSGVLGWCSRARRRVGYSRTIGREGNFLFLTHRADVPARRAHKIERYLDLLRAVGVPVRAPRATLAVPQAAAQAVRTALRVRRRRAGPLAVLHAGTSEYNRYKRWPMERWAEVAGRLIERFDADVVLNVGPGEEALADAIVRACPAPLAPPLTTTLHESVVLIREADLFLSVDTGLLHVASVVGTPSVAVFGPKDSALHGPYGVPARVVELDGIICKPCRNRTCTDLVCIDGIPAALTLAAVRDLLIELGFAPRTAVPAPGGGAGVVY